MGLSEKKEGKVTDRKWKSKSRIMGIPVSLLAIWAALFVAASAIPALPVPGMGGMLTIGIIMSAISGIILGPAAAIGNAAGALIATIIFPFGSFFGPIGFLGPMMGGLICGLLFAGRWKLAAVFELLLIGVWFANPVAWQHLMWIVPLPYSGVALIMIFVKPLREWARRQIMTADKVKMWPAVFLMAATGHSAHFLMSNILTNYMWDLTWQYWVPTWPYWAGVDTIIVAVSTLVGVSVLYGLRKGRLPNAATIYAEELEK